MQELCDLAERNGINDAAAQLREEAQRPASAETTVVVAGEEKRGKSSLINALLSRPGLSPVAPQTATHIYIAFHQGAPELARAIGLSGEQEIPLGALDDWATADSARRHRNVISIDVTLDHPLLAHGLVLIDTPGVGGLDAAHSRMTLQALSRADALLFVLDAGQPIVRGELDFLEQAAARIEIVMLILTKTDQNPHWAEIQQEDLERLTSAAPRYRAAPFLPVSTRRFEEAEQLAARGDNSRATRRRELSGIDAVRDNLLRRVAGKGVAMKQANVARISLAIAHDLEVRLQARAGERGSDELHAKSARAAERLAEARATRRVAPATMVNRLNGVTADVEVAMQHAFADLSSRYRRALSQRVAPNWQQELNADLVATVGALNDQLQTGVADILAHMRQDFEVEDLNVDVDALELPALPDASYFSSEPRGADLRSILSLAGSATSGRAIGSLLGSLGGSAGATLGGWIGGAITVAITLVTRGTGESRDQAIAVLDGVLRHLQIELPGRFRKQLSDLRFALDQALLAALEREGENLRAAAEAAAEEERAASAHRERSRQQAVAQLRQVGSLRAVAVSLRSEAVGVVVGESVVV